MSDRQLVLNAYLFIHLRDSKEIEVKKANVLLCLEKGADVNAVDGNQRNNTPLHVAVTKGYMEIVQLLLDNGAVPNVKNEDHKTPLDIARELKTHSGKQIFQLLINLSKDTADLKKSFKETAVPTVKDVSKPITEPAQKPKRYLYSKRAGTSGVSGHLYETKLLTLVLMRALNDKDIDDFTLGTNIDGIGALDDMCVRLKVKDYDKPIMIYLQAKHREDRDKARLTVENVRNNKGDFSLIKYFDSYLKIKDNFKHNNSDDMFDGNFNNTDTNLVIYTPAKDLFANKSIGKNKLSAKVHQLISTTEKGVVFQFDYEEKDVESLTKMIILNQIKSLGSILLYFIMSEKDKREVIMSNKYIARYHYVLSQEVMLVSNIHEININNDVKQIRNGSFRSEFFTSSSEYLVCLRDFFYKEISSTYCDKTPIDYDTFHNRFQNILQKPNALNISKVIGKLATYNEETLTLEIIDITHIKKKLEQNLSALTKIQNGLSYLLIQPNVVREAVWLKLREMTFNLPTQFGNLDMSFRGTEEKITNRITDVVKKLKLLFFKYQESKIIQINEETAGIGKIIEPGFIEVNGGIGSAVGNLFVLDEDSKMFKIEVDKVLPKRSREVLLQILHFISKDELREYRLEINIDHYPKYHFNGNQFDQKIAKEFLNNLWFYTNQAQEEEVENIIKTEITKHYNNSCNTDNDYVFRLHSDAIFLQFHSVVQKWWLKQGKVHYLNKTSNYFQIAKDAVIDTPLLTVLNFLFIKKLQQLQIVFNTTAVRSLHLQHMVGRLNVNTETIILTALKISQYFHSDNNFTFIEFDYVLSLPQKDYKNLIRDLTQTKINYLIIIYEELIHYKGYCKKIKKIMNAFNGENIIVVSKNSLAEEMRISEGENHVVTVLDSSNNFVDLTEDSQKKILENYKIFFQGEETLLLHLLNKQSKALVVRSEVLKRLLNKDKIEIGKPFAYNTEASDIDRSRFIRDDGTRIQLDNLYDIQHEIVILKSSKARINKSALLTHLSFNTKQLGPLPWIVRINLPDCKNKFTEWIINKTHISVVEVVIFLSKLALIRDFNDEVNFEQDGCNIIVRNTIGAEPMLLFELEYLFYRIIQ